MSRRVVLHGAGFFGLTAFAATTLATRVAASPGRPAMVGESGHLVLDYQGSRQHGWGSGSSIGGHIPAQEFIQDGRRYRVSLLPLARAGGSSVGAPHPVYENEPASPEVGFRSALAEQFGDHYDFRYRGFDGERELRVQSYSAYTRQAPEPSLAISFGADLFLVYHPDRRGGPRLSDDLHWIQVVRSVGPALDNLGRANPFYVTGGRTSIFGREACTFYDRPGLGLGGPDPSPRFLAETFLAHDTGRRDRRGRAIVDVHGGVLWGWQAEELSGT
jgi:hypothetical protein